MEFEVQCGFCEEGSTQNLPLMMSQALAVKYGIQIDEQHLAYIDHLLGLIPPKHPHHANALVLLREDQFLADDEQFLKRIYKIEEFPNKIETLSQYYKFHNNIPRVLDRPIQRIIGRHHDKKRECEYKKIKRLLKEEQGVSITSVADSQSELQRSSYEKKSRYSTILGDLQLSPRLMSDSKLLKEMCKDIDKVFPKKKKDISFQLAGSFEQNRQYFQRFIKMEEQRMHRKGLRKDNKDSKAKLFFERKPKVINKCIYNTNIKIQIKNALFCSNQEFKNGSKISGKLTDAIVFKKRGFLQQLSSWQPSSKFLNQIYKSSRIQPPSRPPQRVSTKESINSSKLKKSTKNSSLQKDQKRTLSNSHSTTKIIQKQQIQSASNSKMINKAKSTSNLRSRSSSHTNLTSTSFKKRADSVERRPVEHISRYGSSQTILNRFDSKTKVRQKKIEDVINRKLHIKPI